MPTMIFYTWFTQEKEIIMVRPFSLSLNGRFLEFIFLFIRATIRNIGLRVELLCH